MASCCGAQRPNTDYEVTFKDGSKRIVRTMMEARIVIAQDTSVDPAGTRKAATMKAVPRSK